MESLTTIVTSSNIDTSVYMWLDIKFHRSHSEKTRKAYTETMENFRGLLSSQGLDLDSHYAAVALAAQAFAGMSTRGKEVAPSTYKQRLSILSSFYRWAKKQGPESPFFIDFNPIETLEYPRIQDYASAQPLEEEEIIEVLARIDQGELAGKRDYALISLLLQTGRRAQEVATLTWGDISLHRGHATVTFTHAKGNKVMIDELPVTVTSALLRWLRGYHGKDALESLAPDCPLWISLARDKSRGQQLGYLSLLRICKKRGIEKVHATRHTFAHHMEEIGASMSEIQARLGHKSLETTGRYLASLRRKENRHGDALAARYGIE